MNRGEYGISFLFSCGFDMSANTSLSITFTKPDETTLTKTATLGTIDTSTTAGIFLANNFVKYTFLNGDVDQSGVWSARVTYNTASVHLISDSAQFTVYP